MEMEENKETVQDILNEIRELSRSAKDGIIAINGKTIAERLETAWRNEAKEIEVNASPLPCVVIKHGNMAATQEAMREALGKVNEIYDILSKPCIVIEEARQACREARGVLIPALDKPPRNCDMYATAEEALKAQQAEFEEDNFKNGECKLGCPDCDNPRIGCKIAWLFANADGGRRP